MRAATRPAARERLSPTLNRFAWGHRIVGRMAIVTIIQEISPEKARAAWTVMLLGMAAGALVVTPLFVMFLFRRTRSRERRLTNRPTQPPIDPWVEAGRRMTDRIDPREDESADDELGDRSGNWKDGP